MIAWGIISIIGAAFLSWMVFAGFELKRRNDTGQIVYEAFLQGCECGSNLENAYRKQVEISMRLEQIISASISLKAASGLVQCAYSDKESEMYKWKHFYEKVWRTGVLPKTGIIKISSERYIV